MDRTWAWIYIKQQCIFSAQAKILLSEIQNSLKLALQYDFRILFGKRAIILQRFQSLVRNIFRDRFWNLANFSLALLIKVLLIKKSVITTATATTRLTSKNNTTTKTTTRTTAITTSTKTTTKQQKAKQNKTATKWAPCTLRTLVDLNRMIQRIFLQTWICLLLSFSYEPEIASNEAEQAS